MRGGRRGDGRQVRIAMISSKGRTPVHPCLRLSTLRGRGDPSRERGIVFEHGEMRHAATWALVVGSVTSGRLIY